MRAETGAIDATSIIPEEDYTVQLGTGVVRRPGTQVTILAWLLMVHVAAGACETLAGEGIDAEMIEVGSLSPIGWELIGGWGKKSGRGVIVGKSTEKGGA